MATRTLGSGSHPGNPVITDIAATLVGLVPAGIAVSSCEELGAVELIINDQTEAEPTRLLLNVEAACDLALRLTGAAMMIRRAAK
jgi:hypothetical protein